MRPSLQAKVLDLRTRGMALDAQFEKELSMTKKLAELKREESEELAAKVKELQGVVRRDLPATPSPRSLARRRRRLGRAFPPCGERSISDSRVRRFGVPVRLFACAPPGQGDAGPPGG